MEKLSKKQIEKKVIEKAKKFNPKSQYPFGKNMSICRDYTKACYLMVLVGLFESNRTNIFKTNSYVYLADAKSDMSGWLGQMILGRASYVKLGKGTPYKTVSAYIVDIKDYKIVLSKSLKFNKETIEFFKKRIRNLYLNQQK